jgi:hypothetical protein
MAPKSRSTRAASALALAAMIAAGAAADEPSDKPAGDTRVTVEKERVRCAPDVPRGRCEEGSKTRVVTEHDVTISIDVTPKPSASCAATVNLESQQRDAVARVTGIIENAQCAASGGDYTLAVTVRGADGERKTLEFPQSWRRDDDKPVTFAHDVPIGANVDLLSVRPRGLRCTCTDAASK